MTTRKINLIVLFFVVCLRGQYSASNPKQVTFLPQGLVLDQMGRTGIMSNVGTQISGNPAELADYASITASFTAQLESAFKSGWVANIGIYRPMRNWLQSAMVVIPLPFVYVGAGYSVRHASSFDFGEIQDWTATTGTDETFSPDFRTIMDAASLQIALPIGKNYPQEGRYGIGIGWSANVLNNFEKLLSSVSNARSNPAYSLSGGLTIPLSPLVGTKGRLSLFYDEGIVISTEQTWTNEDSSGLIRGGSYPIEGALPELLLLRVALLLNPKLEASIAVSWIDMRNSSSLFGTHVEPTVSLRYQLKPDLWTSAGLTTVDVHFVSQLDPIFSISEDGYFKGRYFTWGGGLTPNNFVVEFVAATSHYFSGKGRKQVLGNLSVGYQL